MIPLKPSNPPPAIPTVQEFTGKVALVTGGSDGIGKGIVAALVSVGVHTFFCGRREDVGQATQKELGEKAHFIACNVREPKQISALVEQAGHLKGHIDYLVNNVAMDPNIPVANVTLEKFMEVFETNLRSYYLTTQDALPYLEKGQGKAMVNLGTTNYMKGIPGMTAYNATKSGIVGFTRSLARELGPAGIRVNMISPGWTVTEKQLRQGMDDGAGRYLIDTQCVKELMYPEHIASATLFLLSKAATGVSGQNLIVDGGQVVQ
ncbi:MAG: SDR family oxidoreductase [Phycisphaeraceae bacterium]|nr:SDR family oxidoreductase [Phycisphaeraceae bacterium]